MSVNTMDPGTPNRFASASVECDRRANTDARISSFEKNPESGGIPAMASVAIHINANVHGMYLRRPPMLRMSWASACEPVW
jgi:hypothetical protein